MRAWATASEIAQAVQRGASSAVSVAEAALARVAERDGVLNSFTAVTRDRALANSGRRRPGSLAEIAAASERIDSTGRSASVASP